MSANKLLRMNGFQSSANAKTFGNHDICTFGKYKGGSWYDIANSRNFGYFNWCLNNIALHPSCMDHINTVVAHRQALLQNSNLSWTKEETPLENGNTQRCYKLNDEEKTQGPILELKYCNSCNRLNAIGSFTSDTFPKICNYCLTKPPPKPPMDEQPNYNFNANSAHMQQFNQPQPRFRPNYNSRQYYEKPNNYRNQNAYQNKPSYYQ